MARGENLQSDLGFKRVGSENLSAQQPPQNTAIANLSSILYFDDKPSTRTSHQVYTIIICLYVLV